MATQSPHFFTPYGGQGTVLPERPGEITSTNTNSLSTQLIIWGMVGFIIAELLAILCLLRFCCKARYIRKRKYKEREIILSDSLNNNMSSKHFYSATGGVGGGANSMKQNLVQSGNAINSRHEIIVDHHQPSSSNSSRPILHNQNSDILMVDDITSLYSKRMNKQQQQQPKVIATKSFRIHNQTSAEAPAPYQYMDQSHRATKPASRYHWHQACKISSTCEPSATELLVDRDENMRQEMCNEDVYTLRLTQPVFADGGHINQGFEMISHADIRPTTPVCYEQVEEIATSLNKNNYNNKPQPPPPCHNFPQEIDCKSLILSLKHQHPDLCSQGKKVYQQSNGNGEEIYVFHGDRHRNSMSVASPACHKAASCNDREEKTTTTVTTRIKTRPRSRTQPVSAQYCAVPLNYGNEKNFKNTGQEVEWEVARELRTVNWDKLKEIARTELGAGGGSGGVEPERTCATNNDVNDYNGFMVRSQSSRSKSSPISYYSNRLDDYHVAYEERTLRNAVVCDKESRPQYQPQRRRSRDRIDEEEWVERAHALNENKQEANGGSNIRLTRQPFLHRHEQQTTEFEETDFRTLSSFHDNYQAEFMQNTTQRPQNQQKNRAKTQPLSRQSSNQEMPSTTAKIMRTPVITTDYGTDSGLRSTFGDPRPRSEEISGVRKNNMSVIDVKYKPTYSGDYVIELQQKADSVSAGPSGRNFKSVINISGDRDRELLSSGRSLRESIRSSVASGGDVYFHGNEGFRSINEINLASEDVYEAETVSSRNQELSEMINEIRNLNSTRLKQINDRIEPKIYDTTAILADAAVAAGDAHLSSRQRLNEINKLLNSSNPSAQLY